MAFDFSKLRGRIVEKYGSNTSFAEKIGISTVSLSHKLNGRTSFSADDITVIVEKLDINLNDIGEYFFTQKV